MVVACNLKVLTADRRTTALDMTVQVRVPAFLRKLQAKREMPTIFSIHNLSVVTAIADETEVMPAGSVPGHGSVGALFRSPANSHTVQSARFRLAERRHRGPCKKSLSLPDRAGRERFPQRQGRIIRADLCLVLNPRLRVPVKVGEIIMPCGKTRHRAPCDARAVRQEAGFAEDCQAAPGGGPG